MYITEGLGQEIIPVWKQKIIKDNDIRWKSLIALKIIKEHPDYLSARRKMKALSVWILRVLSPTIETKIERREKISEFSSLWCIPYEVGQIIYDEFLGIFGGLSFENLISLHTSLHSVHGEIGDKLRSLRKSVKHDGEFFQTTLLPLRTEGEVITTTYYWVSKHLSGFLRVIDRKVKAIFEKYIDLTKTREMKDDLVEEISKNIQQLPVLKENLKRLQQGLKDYETTLKNWFLIMSVEPLSEKEFTEWYENKYLPQVKSYEKLCMEYHNALADISSAEALVGQLKEPLYLGNPIAVTTMVILVAVCAVAITGFLSLTAHSMKEIVKTVTEQIDKLLQSTEKELSKTREEKERIQKEIRELEKKWKEASPEDRPFYERRIKAQESRLKEIGKKEKTLLDMFGKLGDTMKMFEKILAVAPMILVVGGIAIAGFLGFMLVTKIIKMVKE